MLGTLQHTIVFSTAEAECIALATNSKEVIHFCQLLPTLSCSITCIIPNYEDSEICIALATWKFKHIDIKHYFFRDLVKQGATSITKYTTFKMPAEILTKSSLPLYVYIEQVCRMLCGTYFGPSLV